MKSNKRICLSTGVLSLLGLLLCSCISGTCYERDVLEQSYQTVKYPYVVDTYSGYIYCRSYEVLDSGNILVLDYYELDGRDFSLKTGEVAVVESANLVSISKRNTGIAE